MGLRPGDTTALRKARGAFFTPPAIADFLACWAIKDAGARVLDPTCGEAVFLQAAGERLRALGAPDGQLARQLNGVDLHQISLDSARDLLWEDRIRANLVAANFFDLVTPSQIGDVVGWQDAVIGNPPFVRYQEHRGDDRRRSAATALAQGVRLSGLASSWAATLVHASAFLKPDGRLAMVLPAELLTVGYAEPVRRWLRGRFAAVNLVMFERLQFTDAEENVVLLVAHGSGACDSFCVIHVDDADDLADVHPLDSVGANPAGEGKWSDLALSVSVRQLFKSVAGEQMSRLDRYGTPELGTVTGSNDFFAISESTRREFKLDERHLKKISPPGTRHLKGVAFTRAQWEELKLDGQRVWLFAPDPSTRASSVAGYVEHGERLGIQDAYKCSVRKPWWRPPAVQPPDLFFTYMSHRYPRLIANAAGTTLVNSMHGLRLRDDAPTIAQEALPLLALNSATMLGAEVLGRAYGGGILKMEPREAASLPVPSFADLAVAWKAIGAKRADLDGALRVGQWSRVVAEVDRVLLRDTMRLSLEQIQTLRDAAALLRVRRTRQTEPDGSAQA